MSDGSRRHGAPPGPIVVEAPVGAAHVERVERAANAAHALCDALWEALHEQLGDRSEGGAAASVGRAPKQRVAEISERLADVAATVALLAGADGRATVSRTPSLASAVRVGSAAPAAPDGLAAVTAPATPAAADAWSTAVLIDERDDQAPGPDQGPLPAAGATVSRTPSLASAARVGSAAPVASTAADASSAAVLIDERDDQAPGPDQGPPPEASPRPQRDPRPLPWGAPPSEQSRALQTPPRIEIRDERGPEGPAAWIDSIGRALEQFERDRLPFAVLLVELVDVERLRREALPGELPRLASQMENALAQALRTIGGGSAASLTRERPGRYWLLAPETDRLGAQALAARLARALGPVGAAAGGGDPTEQYFAALSARRSPPRASQQGAPLKLAVGTAVCPGDGQEAAALAGHADVELSAVHVAGRPIVSVDEPAQLSARDSIAPGEGGWRLGRRAEQRSAGGPADHAGADAGRVGDVQCRGASGGQIPVGADLAVGPRSIMGTASTQPL